MELTSPFYLDIERAKVIMPGCSYIDNDLVLYKSFEDVPPVKEPRTMKCFFAALCLDGNAQYVVDDREHIVGKNTIVIFNEGQVISSYHFCPRFKGMVILISDDFFNETLKGVREISRLFLLAYSNPVFQLSEETVGVFLEYFQIISKKINDQEHHFRNELAMALLKSMIYDLGNEIYHQLLDMPKFNRAEVIFNDFMALVKKHFKEERRVGWYAEQLCITPKYLSEMVKQVSHRTPNDWIDHYVTLEIRAMLKSSSMSIKEIARQLNFPNQSFLGKYFKEHVGISPSKYRRG